MSEDRDFYAAYIRANSPDYPYEPGMRTHTEYGETFTDDHGVRWHQVFEYVNGVCVDRYVTRVGVQL